MDYTLMKLAIRRVCPSCEKGHIFPHRLTLDVHTKCPNCQINLKDYDSGDGAVVFLVFVLSFLLTPLALLLNAYITIPLWAHALIWTFVAIIICTLTMQQLKAYVICLSFKHRGGAKGV